MIRLNFATVNKIQLICVGQGFNREYKGYYNRYKILIDSIPIEHKFSTEDLRDLSYWVNRSKVMAMTCWGSSQEFEAMYSLACFLGWNKQAKDHSDLCYNFIKAKMEAIY